MNDHDLLIKVSANVENLCKKFDKLDDRLNKQDDDCSVCKDGIFENVKELYREKVPWGNFKWIIGILILALLSLNGFTLGMVLDTRERIVATQRHLDNHIYFAGFVYNAVTGEKWDDISREALLRAKDKFKSHMKKADTDKSIVPKD